MLTRILSTLICLIISFSLHSQALEVLLARGEIKNLRTRQILKKDSKYNKTDRLEITNETHRLAVTDQNRNSYIMIPQYQEGALSPHYYQIPYKMQGRPGKVITSSPALINHLGEDQKYLIAGDECRIKFGTSFIKLDSTTSFYIRYYWQGDTISKQLGFNENNELIITKDLLFQAHYEKKDERFRKDTTIVIKQEEISAFEFRCYGISPTRVFYDGGLPDAQQNRAFVPIQLHFLEDEALDAQIPFALSYLEQINQLDFDRLHAFLQNLFNGRLEEDNLRQWLNDHGYEIN